jgi:hypothetical protein
MGVPSDSNYQLYDTMYKYLVDDSYMSRLQDSVSAAFEGSKEWEDELELALRYYMHYFPRREIPAIYTFVAPFVYQVVVTNEAVGIELDMFMGEHFSYYSSLAANLPQYLLYRFHPRYITVSVMRALMDGETGILSPESNLLDEMILEGKMMYYLDLMMPDTPDSIKIGYTKAQLDWCFDNDVEIWKFFAGEELFFSTKTQDKQRYIGEAPNAFGMPEESPGRIGVWLGWQIVRSYMKEHSEMSIQELFMQNDGMKVLEESNYTP